MIEEGRPAPDFTLPSDSGESVSLSQFRGSPVVLYFYPRDNTPGCTAQACGIRDVWSELRRKGAVVLGVSPDSPKKHVKFREKYGLPFTLDLRDRRGRKRREGHAQGEARNARGRRARRPRLTTALRETEPAPTGSGPAQNDADERT